MQSSAGTKRKSILGKELVELLRKKKRVVAPLAAPEAPRDQHQQTDDKKSNSSASEHKHTLSADQAYFREMVRQGKSIFLVAEAGCGKTEVMKQCITEANADILRLAREFDKNEDYEPDVSRLFHPKIQREGNLVLTASTCCAALLLSPTEGQSLHAFAGCQLAKARVPNLVRRMSNEAKERWEKCSVLFLDEGSMCHPDFFEKINLVAQIVRQNRRFMGGVQVIVSADFMQIPPVWEDGCSQRFLFESALWKNLTPVFLTQNFRQQNHAEFLQVLREVRGGQLTDITYRFIQQRTVDEARREELFANNENPSVELFPTKNGAEQRNILEVAKLIGANDKACQLLPLRSQTLEEKLAEVQTWLRDDFFQPGRKSVAIPDTAYFDEYPFARYDITKLYIPAKRKPRGQRGGRPRIRDATRRRRIDKWHENLDKHCLIPPIVRLVRGTRVMLVAHFDKAKGLVNGRVGVVIGFGRRQKVTGVDPDSYWVCICKARNYNPTEEESARECHFCGEWCDSIELNYEHKRYPIVRFTGYGGLATVTEEITPKSMVKKINGEEAGVRLQVPLILAYGLTYHKMQGTTLKRGVIIGEGIFSGNMFYTALSRFDDPDQVYFYKVRLPLMKPDQRCLKYDEDLNRERAKKRNRESEPKRDEKKRTLKCEKKTCEKKTCEKKMAVVFPACGQILKPKPRLKPEGKLKHESPRLTKSTASIPPTFCPRKEVASPSAVKELSDFEDVLESPGDSYSQMEFEDPTNEVQDDMIHSTSTNGEVGLPHLDWLISDEVVDPALLASKDKKFAKRDADQPRSPSFRGKSTFNSKTLMILQRKVACAM